MININNIQKVRKILKGQQGTQLAPLNIGRGYLSIAGFPDLNKSLNTQTNVLKSLSIPEVQIKPIEYSSPTFSKFRRMANGADMARNLLFQNTHVNDSALTSGINATTDAVSSSLMGFSPIGTIAGGAMKLGSFMGDALTSLGIGTDQMTKADQVLDSSFLKITPFGLVNALGAKRTQDFSANQDTIEQVGASYGGTVSDINDAVSKAGKKYGLFSNKKRRRANREIDAAREKQNIMTDIASESQDRRDIATNMSDINHLNYDFNLNGGYDQRYIRAAGMGSKLKRIKKLKLHKIGGTIQQSINVNTKKIENSPVEWTPVITEIVEEFETGGSIEWVPVITLQEGGKSEELSKEKSELEETNQKNIIPEGALHAHRHHMENADNLTKKGIPVIDNDGEQQAEIEREEIIFTLEVTKKLEELYSKYQSNNFTQKEKDEAAIEAGKLLVEQILFNTDDKTGLINTLKKGGKIDGLE